MRGKSHPAVMICHRCRSIPLDLFRAKCEIQYKLHENYSDLKTSAKSGCHSCQVLIKQIELSKAQMDYCEPSNASDWDDYEYWIEWDYTENELVVASGWEHYPLKYDSELGSKPSSTNMNVDKELHVNSFADTPELSQAASPESLRIIKSWLRKCLKEHKGCQTADSALPTRLLDVGTVNDAGKTRIVYGSQLSDQGATYLALSYCWGGKTKQSEWVLNTANIKTRERDIRESQLPQSFLDIIMLARELEVRYVWIDALCILQDSQEDWEKEAATMKRIYTNAICTVVSPASDPQQHIFVERDPLVTRAARLQLRSSDGSHSAVVKFHPILPKWHVKSSLDFHEVGQSDLKASLPTSKRSWCLQEYELSQRVIMFTTHQFVWVCQGMQCSEEEFSTTSLSTIDTTNQDNGPKNTRWIDCIRIRLKVLFASVCNSMQSVPRAIDDGWDEQSSMPTEQFNKRFLDPPGNHRRWEKLVEDYTSRSMTNPQDRLSAVAGIAEKRYEETQDQYLMGLWKSNLKNDLLWRVVDPTTSSRISGLEEVPTWSWVAVNSSVQFPRRPYDLDMFETHMKSPIGQEISIEKVDIRGASGSAFVTPRSVRIVLKGRLIQTSLHKSYHTARDGSVGKVFTLMGKSNFKVGNLIPDDCNLMLEDRTLSCLWMDAGIIQDLDLEGEPERYTGGFGIALLYKRCCDGLPIYARVGFVEFHGPMVKKIHTVEASRFGLV
jgi:hypothetical protein